MFKEKKKDEKRAGDKNSRTASLLNGQHRVNDGVATLFESYLI